MKHLYNFYIFNINWGTSSFVPRCNLVQVKAAGRTPPFVFCAFHSLSPKLFPGSVSAGRGWSWCGRCTTGQGRWPPAARRSPRAPWPAATPSTTASTGSSSWAGTGQRSGLLHCQLCLHGGVPWTLWPLWQLPLVFQGLGIDFIYSWEWKMLLTHASSCVK